MRLRQLFSGVLVALVVTTVAEAQVSNVERVRSTDRMVVGGSTFGEVMRIVGSPTVSSGTGTQNPSVIDADGDVLEDNNTTVSTAGAWTWSAAGTFSATLAVTGNTTLTGNLIGGTGTLLVTSPTSISNTSPFLRLIDSDAGSDEKVWQLTATSNQLALQTLTDAFGSAADVFRLYRTGNDAARWDWGANVDFVQPSANYQTSLGAIDRKYIDLWAANLSVDIITAREVMATIGGRILVGPTTLLTLDLAPSDVTFCVKHNNLRGGDLVLMEDFGKFEVIGIDAAAPTSAACGYIYNLSRSLDPSSAKQWYAGDGVFSTGQTGSGFWDIYADWSSAGIFSYSPKVMASGPVAYWRLGDLTTSDISGSGLTLTVNGTINSASGTAAAISDSQGGAETVSGGYLSRADHATLDIIGALTIEAWINWQTATAGVMLSKGGATGEYEVVIDNSGRVDFNSGNGSSTTTAIAACNTGAITTVTWIHLVITRDASNIRCYINSTLNKTTAYSTAPTAGTGNLGIFARSGGTSPLPSGTYLDEVAIYARTLTQSEITQHYDSRTFTTKTTQYGPTMCANVRQSSTYNDWRERLCIGNLQGKYDYATPEYGVAAGNFAGDWFSVDPTKGVRLMDGTTTMLQAVGGSLFLTDDLSIGTSGQLRSGATAYDTTTGYWLDYNSGTPRFRIGTTTAGTSYLRWTGSALELKSNTLTIDANGIIATPNSGASHGSPYGYRFSTAIGSSEVGVFSYEVAGGRSLALINSATAPGRLVQSLISATGAGGSSSVRAFDDNAGGNGAELVTPNASVTLTDSALSIGTISTLQINGVSGLSTTVVVPCGTLTFTHGWLTSKGTC